MALCVLHASTGNPSWLGGVSQRDVAPAEERDENEPGVEAKDEGEKGVGEVEGGDEVEGLGVGGREKMEGVGWEGLGA